MATDTKTFNILEETEWFSDFGFAETRVIRHDYLPLAQLLYDEESDDEEQIEKLEARAKAMAAVPDLAKAAFSSLTWLVEQEKTNPGLGVRAEIIRLRNALLKAGVKPEALPEGSMA